jgi:methyltransferase
MSWLYVILGAVALQRIAEMIQADRNTKRLLARGAIEIASYQHPFFILFHASWLLSMVVFLPASAPPNWWLIASYALIECARVWTITSLGPYWTTRIITVPNEPLVRRGPYRFVSHPNYVVVACEIALLPLAFGAWAIAIIATLVNALLLTWRIRAENQALSERRRLPQLP